MTCPFETHRLPNGDELVYRDTDHSYYRECAQKADGKWSGKGRLAGVSTVSKPYEWDATGLMGWAAKLSLDGVAALAADGLSLDEADDMRSALGWLESGPGIYEALADARLTWRDLRDQAAARGTNVHEHVLHALAAGEPVPKFDALTEEEAGYGQGVMGAWLELDPVPEHSEIVVADLELGVAGRLDLICGIDGERVLLDCKTTSGSGFVPVSHHVQLAGYARLAETCGYGAVDRQVVLQVRPDGGWELIDGLASEADFLTALGVYRRNREIRGEVARARKHAATTMDRRRLGVAA